MMKCAFLTALSQEIPNDERTSGIVARYLTRPPITPERMLGEASGARAIHRSDAIHPRHQASFRSAQGEYPRLRSRCFSFPLDRPPSQGLSSYRVNRVATDRVNPRKVPSPTRVSFSPNFWISVMDR